MTPSAGIVILLLSLTRYLALASLEVEERSQTGDLEWNLKNSNFYKLSGFIIGTSSLVDQAYQVDSKIQASFAHKFMFNDNSLSFLKKEFILVAGEFINGKYIWFDGQYYLFFMNPVDKSSFGTWLIGPTAGIDSGIAYMRIHTECFIPYNLESDVSVWNVLESGKWIPRKDLRLHPDSTLDYIEFSTASYYERGELISSTVLWTAPTLTSNVSVTHLDMLMQFITNDHSVMFPSNDFVLPAIWDSQNQLWKSLKVKLFVSFGLPVHVHVPHSPPNAFETQHLIKYETFNSNSWRLSMRSSDDSKEKSSLLVLNSNGFADGIKVTQLNNHATYIKDMNSKFESSNVGDYLWLWYYDRNLNIENVILHCKSKFSNTSDGEGGRVVFEYFQSDRRVTMSRTVMDYSMRVVVARKVVFGDSTFQYVLSIENMATACNSVFDREEISPLSVFAIGPHPLQWIKRHLLAHEKTLNPTLSSCYMYHAAFALPEQFVYAAEMMCVLMGAKPVTMVGVVQYYVCLLCLTLLI